MLIGSLAFLSACARGPAATPPAPDPTPPPNATPAPGSFDIEAPRGRIQLHWNDAADTTRLLRAPADKPLRITATITDADSLRGFTLLFRVHPARPDSTAWTFQPRPGCDPATFVITAEKDPQAPAPWMRKLLLTDKVEHPDGDRLFYVIAAYDDVIVDPDSTYSLCHLDLEPGVVMGDGTFCGWDVPMQVSLDVAKVALFGRDVPARDFGHGLYYEPIRVSP